ncbi:uncharacterized protein LOC114286624 [Camellia sinensis]|uniref:uncharacterized protein LOC114286624 n=1 Tax=Camellia sinensis TaxID=4442 RepID=UPI0010357EA9|nr:uncharacterized protein LOC114286624 [Camellia sinensis]
MGMLEEEEFLMKLKQQYNWGMEYNGIEEEVLRKIMELEKKDKEKLGGRGEIGLLHRVFVEVGFHWSLIMFPMKILIWNIRGIGREEKRGKIRKLVNDRNIDIVLIQETKKAVITNREVREMWVRTRMEFMSVDSEGTAGGLLCIWDQRYFNLVLAVVADGSYSYQRYPDVAKFRRMLLQFFEDLDILFSIGAATGEWAYAPSSGVMPNIDETREEFHTPHDVEFDHDVDLKVVHPSNLNNKIHQTLMVHQTRARQKKKVSGVILLNKTLDHIVNVVESSSATSTQTLARYPSITECLAKLESIPGVSPDDDMYVWATRLFLRDKRSECFMPLPIDEVWLRFLKLEIEIEKTSRGCRG